MAREICRVEYNGTGYNLTGEEFKELRDCGVDFVEGEVMSDGQAHPIFRPRQPLSQQQKDNIARIVKDNR